MIRNALPGLLVVIAAFYNGCPVFAAGGRSDGGGNAVVCFDQLGIPDQIRSNEGELTDNFIPHIQSVETFDLYEARLPRGVNGKLPVLALIGPNENLDSYIGRLNARLSVVAPILAREIKESEDLFTDDNIINDQHGLEKIDDVNAVSLIAPNCVLATMAIQLNNQGQYSLHLDQRLFDHPLHSQESRAALILHEYIYRYARELGQTDSANTRALLSMILEQDQSVRIHDFLDKAEALGFLPQYLISYWASGLHERARALAFSVISGMITEAAGYDPGAQFGERSQNLMNEEQEIRSQLSSFFAQFGGSWIAPTRRVNFPQTDAEIAALPIMLGRLPVVGVTNPELPIMGLEIQAVQRAATSGILTTDGTTPVLGSDQKQVTLSPEQARQALALVTTLHAEIPVLEKSFGDYFKRYYDVQWKPVFEDLPYLRDQPWPSWSDPKQLNDTFYKMIDAFTGSYFENDFGYPSGMASPTLVQEYPEIFTGAWDYDKSSIAILADVMSESLDSPMPLVAEAQ
jgi:hypothetical protein